MITVAPGVWCTNPVSADSSDERSMMVAERAAGRARGARLRRSSLAVHTQQGFFHC